MSRTLPISPEYAVLLEAMTSFSRPAGAVGATAPGRWDEVLRLAAWHRLSPLLHRHLATCEQVPPHVRDALEDAYLANAARNLLLRAELERVLATLATAEIPVVLLKGAALVEAVYPDPGLREMTDLDVLVPAHGLDGANAALARIGYRPALPVATEQDTAAWMRVHHHHDPPLIGDMRIAAVELHHHLIGPEQRRGLNIADVWRRARPAAGGTHLLPGSEDLLLHVCLHFMFNRTGRCDGSLGQVVDIAWIVGRAPIDWSALGEMVRSYDLQAGVFLALFVARELGAAVPQEALAQLRPAGFDPSLGRRLAVLRVLRDGPRFPVRSLRWMVAPGRECLARGWDADPDGLLSLARGYARRASAQLPLARSALREPGAVVQDYRLNRQIAALDGRPATTVKSAAR